MLAQTEVGDLAPVFAWLAAAALAFGPGAIGITKLVDGLRSFDKDNDWWEGWWIVAAFAIGVVVCLAFQVNVIAGLVAQLPAFAGSHALDGVAGQVVTGLGMGGMASYWHERMDLASSTAKGATSSTATAVGELHVEEAAEPPVVSPAPKTATPSTPTMTTKPKK